jgi:hypothetical protein
MAAQCQGEKRDGSRCSATVNGPSSYCWLHAPENADRRRQIASKAGRSDGGHRREIQSVKGQLRAIANAVVAGELEPRAATAGVQALNAYLRAVQLDREIGAAAALDERLRAVEALEKESRRWAG